MSRGLLLVVTLIVMVLSLFGQTASAQQATSPDAPSALELRTLLELLEDPAIRAWLRQQVETLDAQAATPAPSSGFLLSGGLAALELRLETLHDALGRIPSELSRAWLILDLELDESSLWLIVLSIAGLLAIGAILEWLFWRVTQRFRRAIAEARLATPADRIRVAGLRLLLALLSVGVFTAGSVGVFLMRPWPPIVGLIVLTYLTAFVYYRLAQVFARFAFAPEAPRLRLLPLTDAQARFLMRGALLLVAIAAIGLLSADLLEQLGIAPYSVELLRLLTMLALAVAVVALRLRSKRLAPWETGARRLQRPLLAQAATWLFVAAAGLWWVLQVLDLTVIATVVLVAALLPAALRLCNAIASGLDRPPGERAAAEEMPHLGVVLIGRGLRGLVLLLAAWTVLDAFKSRGMMVAGNLDASQAVVGAIFTTLIAYVIADLLWQVVRHGIERRIRDEGTETGESHAIAARSRLGTLLPLVKSVVGAFLVIAVAMIGLSAFGVDIGPLLAGAGVIGIAIGFGAQALVRDIFSGVFFLLDDAFRVGEYIEIESLRGTVEAISVRSMRLRHHRGAVHTIPYGEVRSITNYSRDWVIVKLEFRVPFDTDLALVKRLVKEIGRELQNDPLLGPNLIEPLKSQGVRRVEEYNAVLGVKFMAKPGEQFTIRREAYHRILNAFEANGIQLASRSVRVEAPSGREGEAVAAQAFAADAESGPGR